ncbi:MarR family transcriptional regulator [Hwanghaeella grinnelliae]|uniref:MarR family transcriptional regulator n=1 Tax=Hwanghaeella grinnelliae TaxID=2500179 RepID=A0A3S2VS48_9PROT|nr:MarR family transcriptional regulator [Hwanghaeella grinnelliae]RVU39231.1 MarR family transcriptional regulator [Hwanghaeella grinnelliae]
MNADGVKGEGEEKSADDPDIFEEDGLESLADLMSFHIRIMNMWISRFLEKHFQGTPLAGGTGKVTALMMTQGQPGITASELAIFTGKDAPAMARLVDRLIADGLIERRPDPASKRRQLLFTTPKGDEMVVLIKDTIAKERSEVFWMLSDEEHDLAVKVLRKSAAAYAARRAGSSSDWVAPWARY